MRGCFVEELANKVGLYVNVFVNIDKRVQLFEFLKLLEATYSFQVMVIEMVFCSKCNIRVLALLVKGFGELIGVRLYMYY